MEPQTDFSNTSRLRSWSNRVSDRLRGSPSRKSGPQRETISALLGKAGVVSGTLGSPFVDPKRQLGDDEQDKPEVQDVKDGTLAFLQVLDLVASNPQYESDGPLRAGTFKLKQNGGAEDDLHPITNAVANPFECHQDDASIISYDFTEDILVRNKEGKVFMRAMLDTGMSVNAIHLEKVKESGFEIVEYAGPALRDADGPEIEPEGKVDLQFHFMSWQSARTWKLEFVVLRDPPFDVAFGKRFIKQAGLLKKADIVLPLTYQYQNSEEKAHQDRVTKEKDAKNAAEVEREKDAYAARRKKEKEKKADGGSGKKR